MRATLAALALVIAGLATIQFAQPAHAAPPNCQCTDYVYSYNHLTNNYPNAALWGNGHLQNNGWYSISYPRVGGIVVIKGAYLDYVSYTRGGSTFPYWLAKDSAGHVGVGKASYLNPGGQSWTIEIQSANSGLTSHYFTDGPCTDVADYWWVTAGSGGLIQFWTH
jgi:hypothetical protein